MSPESFGRIAKIAIAPVKGARLVELQNAVLTPQGFKGDREYIVVQAQPDSTGVHRWVSQRD